MLGKSASGLLSPRAPRAAGSAGFSYELFQLVRVVHVGDAGDGVPAPPQATEGQSGGRLLNVGSRMMSSLGTLTGLRRGDGAGGPASQQGSQGESSDVGRGRAGSASGPVRVINAVSGGCDTHTLVALYTSNAFVVFRFVGKEGAPIVKHMRWRHEEMYRFVSMAFDADGVWLMCMTADHTLVLIPAFYLLCPRKAPAFSIGARGVPTNSRHSIDSRFKYRDRFQGIGPTDDITIINVTSKQKSTGGGFCLWWIVGKPTSTAYAVTVSSKGTIRFINLVTRECDRHVISLDDRPLSAEMIRDTRAGLKYLLIHAQVGGYFKLLLEQSKPDGSVNTVLEMPNQAPFKPVIINRLTHNYLVSVQKMRRDIVLGLHNPSKQSYEVFDAALSNYPLFVYQLPAQSEIVHITDRLIFVGINNPATNSSKLYVVSNIIASTVTGNWQQKRANQSIVQEFVLDGCIKGLFRSNFLSLGLVAWTTDGAYELRQYLAPEAIFFQLISNEMSREADALGKTVGLDLLSLYEEAADYYFGKKDFGRSLGLYYLSNVRSEKLVYKFVEIGRTDIAITHLRSTLKQPESLSSVMRKRLSDILLSCYLQSHLCSAESSFAAVDEDFERFLVTNCDYNFDEGMRKLYDAGLLIQILRSADSRQFMRRALDWVCARGGLHNHDELVAYLQAHGYDTLLTRTTSGRALLTNYTADERVRIMLKDTSQAWEYATLIRQELPSIVKEETLLQIVESFDPEGETMMHARHANRLTGAGDRQKQRDHTSACLDLFITASLCLCHRRALLSRQKVRRRRRRLSYLRQITDGASSASAVPPVLSSDSRRESTPVLYETLHDKKVTTVSCGWNHAAAITDSGVLYTWGRNKHGQLGLGNTENATQPTAVETLADKHSVSIACGGEHTLAVTINGVAFAWGNNSCGQLGLGSDTSSRLCVSNGACWSALTPCEPTEVELQDPIKATSRRSNIFEKPKAAACGYYHSALLTTMGRVFSCGSGEQGELGHGLKKSASRFMAIQNLEEGCEIQCGHVHSVLRTENGEVLSWGSGYYGQLGHGDVDDRSVPTFIQALRGKRITKIACGSFHTIAISDLSNIYTWGRGNKGRLGHGNVEDCSSPKLVQSVIGKKITDVSAGYWHSLAVERASGVAYAWGHCSAGQLGLGRTDDAGVLSPEPILPLQHEVIVQVHCGEYFSIVLSDTGTMFSFGLAASGQLGLGTTEVSPVPQPIKLQEKFSFRRLSAQPETARSATDSSSSYGSLSAPTSQEFGALGYGQEVLEQALRKHFGSYTAAEIIRSCLDWSNYGAASIVYEKCGDLPRALYFALEAAAKDDLREEAEDAEEAEASEMPVLLSCSLADAFLQQVERFALGDKIRTSASIDNLSIGANKEGSDGDSPESAVAVVRAAVLLVTVVEFHKHSLDMQRLEDWMMRHMEELSSALEALLMAQFGTSPEHEPWNWVSQFSTELYVCLCRHVLARDDEKSSTAITETDTRLLHTITENLDKDFKLRQSISLPIVTVAARSENSDKWMSSSERDSYAFTCGHLFLKRRFFDHVIPRFEQLAAAFPIPVPNTVKAILEDLRSPEISHACPVCIYNALRQAQEAALPAGSTASISSWDL